jgi:DNA-binding Xre family transcriptional regulator
MNYFGGNTMEKIELKISFSPLWKLLIDRKISKSELRKRTHIAASTFTKMNNDQMVSLDVLARICYELGCTFDDVVKLESRRKDI